MKINRLKKANKILSFYRNHFGFRVPYQVLLDGTFAHKALKHQVLLREQVPKYLGSEVKLLITPCILTEVEKLGPLTGALPIIKQFPLRSCGHGKSPISAVKCLLSVVEKEQETEHYIIATQDPSLIRGLREKPNVPILTLKEVALTLLKPSSHIKVVAEESAHDVEPTAEEIELLHEMKKRELPPEPPSKKRKRPKGPNPLSCKKSKKSMATGSQQQQQSSKKRRQRKRTRSKVPRPVEKVISALGEH